MKGSTTKYDEFRDTILDAAEEVFAKFGFKKTTMNDIADRLNKSKSSIYYYFTSKEQIFSGIIEKESEKLRSEISRAVEKEPLPINKLKAFLKTTVELSGQLTNLTAVLVNESLKHFSIFQDIIHEMEQQKINTLVDILEEGKQKGSFIIENIEQTASLMLTALKGFEFSFLFSDDFEGRKDVDGFLSMMINGIRYR